MSTFKHNKGNLVEQPTMSEPDQNDYYEYDHSNPSNPEMMGFDMNKYNDDCYVYNEHLSSLRTYIAEGNFLEDELVEEKDLDFVKQCFGYYPDVHKWTWCDCEEIDYSHRRDNARRIIARRKVTKEEGEKPDCSQHPKSLFGETDMKKVAEAISFLHYESLYQLLYLLSKEIEFDGEADHANGREKTAEALQYLSMALFESSLRAEKLWKICKPFMKPNNLT